MMKASDGKLSIDEFKKFKGMMDFKLRRRARTLKAAVSKKVRKNKGRGGGRRKNRYKTRKKRKISKKYKTRKKRKASRTKRR